MDEIRLKPCPSCGGQPIVLVRPGWPSPAVKVQCSDCKEAGPWTFFAPDGPTYYFGVDRVLLPDLATARRQAAAAWNERTGADDRTE